MSAEQKVAIVTGASQGIGAGLVKSFCDRNYRVVANSRSINPSNDPDVLAVAGDISKPETARAIVEQGLSRFGRIDSLVNNAGIFIGKKFTDYTEADFSNMLAVNLAGFFHVAQASIAAMARQGSGHVVNVTTSLVDHANSKGPSALASLTKAMHPPESYEGLAKFHPLGRMGEVQDVVDAVLFLESAGFVTGEILHVDGGQSAGH